MVGTELCSLCKELTTNKEDEKQVDLLVTQLL